MPADATLPGLFTDESRSARCAWCQATPLYRHYHDTEWGFPVADERRLFEKICLEGFQAGLSWLTILNKREAFRSAFANFDAQQVARFDAADVQRLLGDLAQVAAVPADQGESPRSLFRILPVAVRGSSATMSPTLLLRRSGQFSLKVRPSTLTLASFT